MKYLILLVLLTGCTGDRITIEKFNACDSLCKPNGGIDFVKPINNDVFFFPIDSKFVDCFCKNKAQFKNLKAVK